MPLSQQAVDRRDVDLRIYVDQEKENASFYPSTGQMVLGIGAGGIAKSGLSMAASKDVFAHEIIHGIIGSTSGLVYEYQSGALNESFSDQWHKKPVTLSLLIDAPVAV